MSYTHEQLLKEVEDLLEDVHSKSDSLREVYFTHDNWNKGVYDDAFLEEAMWRATGIMLAAQELQKAIKNKKFDEYRGAKG